MKRLLLQQKQEMEAKEQEKLAKEQEMADNEDDFEVEEQESKMIKAAISEEDQSQTEVRTSIARTNLIRKRSNVDGNVNHCNHGLCPCLVEKESWWYRYMFQIQMIWTLVILLVLSFLQYIDLPANGNLMIGVLIIIIVISAKFLHLK